MESRLHNLHEDMDKLQDAYMELATRNDKLVSAIRSGTRHEWNTKMAQLSIVT